MTLTTCPPHVRKNWLLGCARRERAEARKQSVSTVTAALRRTPRFVFMDEEHTWRHHTTADMAPDDLTSARCAWKEADDLEFADDAAHVDHTDAVVTDRLCHPSGQRVHDTSAAHASGRALSVAVRRSMDLHMRTRFKWTHRELHDAVCIAGLHVPDRPSLLSYFHILHTQFGDTQVGFLPQAFHTHTKKNYRPC